MAKLIAVDLDKTLTNETCWTEEECLKATPRQNMIDYVNTLYFSGELIIIWTARRETLREATEYWLRKNKVCYHTIDMHKLGADVYCDDKAVNSLDVSKVIEYITNVQTGEFHLSDMFRVKK